MFHLQGLDSATQDDQDQHHDHCNSDQAAAPAAGRAAEVAVERRHVLGIETIERICLGLGITLKDFFDSSYL